jgi:phytoene dehydrogenase-like protein
MARQRTVVVGGGISGLVCALELERGGHEVILLEREDAVGGRVRTSVEGGFTLDEGFQVLFTAYPVLCSYLDLGALDLRYFLPAARLVVSGPRGAAQTSLIGDAVQSPSLLLDTIAARHVSAADKVRLLALRFLATSLSVDDCFSPRYSGTSTRDFLLRRGLSRDVVDRFFAPFYGGILLDRSLATCASILLFTFKMLAEGRTAVPAAGMRAIPEQLAARLAPSTVRTDAAVVALDVVADRARGVRLESGERIEADDVVLAADPPVTASLAATAGVRLQMPRGALRCTTLYYAASEPPLPGQALWLNAARNATVSHAVTISEVAPEYAPSGRHLLVATAVGKAADLDDRTLLDNAARELHFMRGSALPPVELLHVCRVAYAQYPQPPHFREHRPSIATPIAGLWVGGEALHSSSLDGAARGGRDAARAILSAKRAGTGGG